MLVVEGLVGPGPEIAEYLGRLRRLHHALGQENPDHVLGDNESLEGYDGSDVLIGDNGANSFLGHLGADTFIGKGGNDFIDAVDGKHDTKIDCGPGNDQA